MVEELKSASPAQVIEGPPVSPKESSVEVVGSIGKATELLASHGTLKPYNCWFGISTSKKTYPDDMVIEYARWAKDHSGHFMVVIADYMQIFNQMAEKDISLKDLVEDPKKREWALQNQKEYNREARKRQRELKEKLHSEGLTNARVRLWSGLHRMLSRRPIDYFNTSTFEDIGLYPGVDPILDESIDRIVEKRAQHIIGKAADSKNAIRIAGYYARKQWVVSMALASLEGYKYIIKLGPETEQVYDELVVDALRNGTGTLRGAFSKPNEDIPFGAVYLRHSPQVMTSLSAE
jgi:hypothetical protein